MTLKRELRLEIAYQVDKLVNSKLEQYHVQVSQLEKQNASLNLKLAAIDSHSGEGSSGLTVSGARCGTPTLTERCNRLDNEL